MKKTLFNLVGTERTKTVRAVFSVLLVLALLVSLAACRKDVVTDPVLPDDGTTTTTASTTTTAEPTSTAETSSTPGKTDGTSTTTEKSGEGDGETTGASAQATVTKEETTTSASSATTTVGTKATTTTSATKKVTTTKKPTTTTKKTTTTTKKTTATTKKDVVDTSKLTGTQEDVGKVVGYSSVFKKEITVVSVVEKVNGVGLRGIETMYSDGTVTCVVECEHCHQMPCPDGGEEKCSKYSVKNDATKTCLQCGLPKGDGHNGTCYRTTDWDNGGKIICHHYD